MALDFPPNSTNPNPPQNGDKYTDGCNNVWQYNGTDNSWSIVPPAFEFPDVDPDNIWARTSAGKITPINQNDELIMGGSQAGDINLSQFPDASI